MVLNDDLAPNEGRFAWCNFKWRQVAVLSYSELAQIFFNSMLYFTNLYNSPSSKLYLYVTVLEYYNVL